MTGARRIWSVLVGQSGRRLLALLLVGALFLCHGAYGALHQIHQGAGDAALPAMEHAAHADTGGTEDGVHPAGHRAEHLVGDMAYAATLVVISLGAFLRWLINDARAWSRVGASSLIVRCFPLLVVRPVRGPTLSILQVFRL